MKNKHNFSFAGLDFVFDRKMRPYFLEANSFPGMVIWRNLYKNLRPVRLFEKYLISRKCKTLAILTTKKHLKTEKSLKLITEGFKKVDVRICLIKENEAQLKRNSRKLIDKNGKTVRFDCLLRRKSLFKYNPEGILEVNSPEIMRITRNKWLSYLAIRNAFIRSPTSFLVKNRDDILKVVDENMNMFKSGLILKPTFGEKGKNIKIIKDLKRLKNIEIKRPYILQRLIKIKKMKGKYWDLRAFVINGKYVGSVLRMSDSPITNVSLGGMTKAVPEEIEKRIKKRSEKCVKVIENFTELI